MCFSNTEKVVCGIPIAKLTLSGSRIAWGPDCNKAIYRHIVRNKLQQHNFKAKAIWRLHDTMHVSGHGDAFAGLIFPKIINAIKSRMDVLLKSGLCRRVLDPDTGELVLEYADAAEGILSPLWDMVDFTEAGLGGLMRLGGENQEPPNGGRNDRPEPAEPGLVDVIRHDEENNQEPPDGRRNDPPEPANQPPDDLPPPPPPASALNLMMLPREEVAPNDSASVVHLLRPPRLPSAAASAHPSRASRPSVAASGAASRIEAEFIEATRQSDLEEMVELNSHLRHEVIQANTVIRQVTFDAAAQVAAGNANDEFAGVLVDLRKHRTTLVRLLLWCERDVNQKYRERLLEEVGVREEDVAEHPGLGRFLRPFMALGVSWIIRAP